MTKELNNTLPAEAPTQWSKPTFANTKGGKLYKPTHGDIFRVEFTQSEGDDEEAFSSKAVAQQVSSFLPCRVRGAEQVGFSSRFYYHPFNEFV